MDVKGYAVVECTADDLRVRFRAPRTVAEPESEIFDLRRFRVARGTPEVLDDDV